jgi:hypothetical protein
VLDPASEARIGISFSTIVQQDSITIVLEGMCRQCQLFELIQASDGNSAIVRFAQS